MSELPFNRHLTRAFTELRKDLIHEEGPRISTMRSYRFAILQYDPADELTLRAEVQRLASDLVGHGWRIIPLDLQKLLLDRVRAQGPEWAERVASMERRVAAASPERGLNHLKSKLAPLIEGEGGLAADCARLIAEDQARHPETADRTLALIGRAGGLYPFFRTSALLRHLDGRTAGVPVVLLYPGTCEERNGVTGLRFMGILPADHDYRPRIYRGSEAAL